MSDIFEKKFCSLTGKKQGLEDLIDFPTDFSLKFMGLTETIILENVLKKIEEISKQNIAKENIKIKQSSKGKYTSYTVKLYLKDSETLKSLYKMLKEDKSIAYLI